MIVTSLHPDHILQPKASLVPMVIEESGRGERAFDIFSRMLRDRIVFLHDQVSDASASVIIAQLLLLESEDPEKEITFYINSPGGTVHSGLAIYDTMKYLKCPVRTVGMGMCASMGAFLLASGTKGLRSALPNTEIMIHQPLGGAQGQASDIEISARQILKTRDRLNKLLSEFTGQPIETIAQSVDRDNYMDPQAALEFGLIDKIITR